MNFGVDLRFQSTKQRRRDFQLTELHGIRRVPPSVVLGLFPMADVKLQGMMAPVPLSIRFRTMISNAHVVAWMQVLLLHPG